ncbi:hypothetical protein C0989_002609 [Termitomyces sp. Mn162]|nr:hypothetical protein C0989_002609 [Termitomyces sp. Mn162]
MHPVPTNNSRFLFLRWMLSTASLSAQVMRAAVQRSLQWSTVVNAEWAGGNGYFTAGAHRTVHGGLRDLLSIVKNVPSPEAIERIDMEPYTREHFVGDIMRLGNGRSDPALVDTLVDNSRAAITWLAKSVQVPFAFSFNRQAYEIDGRQKFWGGMVLSVENGGKGLIAAHRKALQKAGVKVWFSTPALSFILSDDKISGLVVRRDGHEVELRARAVILAAGGFEANAELREEYLGAGWAQARVRGTPYNTGDGFALAKAVGAKFTGDWAGCHSTAWDANAAANAGERNLTNQYTKSGYPLGIMVNANGVRFVDEGEDYRNYTYAKFGRAILNQPGGFAFQIWDSQVIASLRKEEYGEDVVEKIFASTVQELAEKLAPKGMTDKECFLMTLKEFNEAVYNHRDEHPYLQWDPAVKDGLSTQSKTKQLTLPKSNWALPLNVPPFMAVKVACGVTFTFGGLAIDPQSAAVLREGGRMIPGLFCTGEMLNLEPLTRKSANVTELVEGSSTRLMSLAGIVQQPKEAVNESENAEAVPGSPFHPYGARLDGTPIRSPGSYIPSLSDSPSMRTGPPRTLSYTLSPSTSLPRENPDLMSPDGISEFPLTFPNDFRSALEYEQTDKKGKKRESRTGDESWNPMKWFQDSARDSPSQEKSGFDVDTHDPGDLTPRAATSQTPVNKSPRIGFSSHLQSSSTNETFIRPGASPSTHKSSTSPTSLKFSTLRRAFPSSPDPNSDARSGRDGNRWSMIRSLIPKIISQHREEIQTGPSVASHSVNITDELITGGLATLMLRLWFERDEKDHRRIPVLLHRLRIRVSDSLHPLHGHKSVFRIECEYANGAARWVIYRLRYLKFLKKEGRDVSQTDFARLQRESLENYLIELIRAVMFHPSSNRLAAFLEISALSLATAQSGGCQYKAGYLEIAADGLGGGFGRKSAGWRARKASRWCAIRESYLVVMEEPGELTIWDVFLLDPEFEIERPKRYYRQGLNLLHIEGPSSSHKPTDKVHHPETGRRSMIGSVSSRFSKLFHADGGRRAASVNDAHGNDLDGSAHGSESSESVASQAPPAMLDPSTNVNPLVSKNDEQLPEGRDHSEDVSKHTFYVTNAQMRLKLFARNERQMLQWITAFEKVAATSHYVGKNRFDSFAPIRLNVAAQWLVDGVRKPVPSLLSHLYV